MGVASMHVGFVGLLMLASIAQPVKDLRRTCKWRVKEGQIFKDGSECFQNFMKRLGRNNMTTHLTCDYIKAAFKFPNYNVVECEDEIENRAPEGNISAIRVDVDDAWNKSVIYHVMEAGLIHGGCQVFPHKIGCHKVPSILKFECDDCVNKGSRSMLTKCCNRCKQFVDVLASNPLIPNNTLPIAFCSGCNSKFYTFEDSPMPKWPSAPWMDYGQFTKYTEAKALEEYDTYIEENVCTHFIKTTMGLPGPLEMYQNAEAKTALRYGFANTLQEVLESWITVSVNAAGGGRRLAAGGGRRLSVSVEFTINVPPTSTVAASAITQNVGSVAVDNGALATNLEQSFADYAPAIDVTTVDFNEAVVSQPEIVVREESTEVAKVEDGEEESTTGTPPSGAAPGTEETDPVPRSDNGAVLLGLGLIGSIAAAISQWRKKENNAEEPRAAQKQKASVVIVG